MTYSDLSCKTEFCLDSCESAVRSQTGRGTFPLFAEQLDVIKGVFTFLASDAAKGNPCGRDFAGFHNVLSFLTCTSCLS